MDYARFPAQFWARVDVRTRNECWLWLRAKDREGYGITRALGEWRAHRVAYRLAVGPIPEGLQVQHECDTPLCCNPAHLSVGDVTRNNRDSWLRGRHRNHFKVQLFGAANPMNTRPECRPRGEANGQAVLTERIVLWARQKHKRGVPTDRLRAYLRMRGLKVSDYAFRSAVNGKTWKHLPL